MIALPTQKLLLGSLSIILVYASGIWLRKLGQPYPVFLITIHKLLALAAVVFLVLTVFNIWRQAPQSATLMKMLLVTGALFILNLASGAMLTSEKTFFTAIQIAHRVGSLLFLIALVVSTLMMYLAIWAD